MAKMIHQDLDGWFVGDEKTLSKLSEQVAEIERLKDERDAVFKRFEAKASEAATLRAEIERLKAELAESEYVSSARLQDSKHLSNQHAALRARVEELEGLLTVDMSRLGRNIDKLKEERDELRTQLADSRILNGNLNEELEENSHASDRLRTEVAAQELQLRAYESQLTLQEEGPASLLASLDRKNKDIDYLWGQNSALKANTEELSARLTEREDLYRLLDEAYEGLENAYDSLELRLAAEQAAGFAAAKRIVDLEASADLAISAADDFKKLNDELTQKLETSRRIARSLETDLAEAHEKLASNPDLWQLLQDNEDLRGKLAALQPPAPTIVKRWFQAVTDNNLVCCPCETEAEADYEADGNILGYLVRVEYSDGTVKALLEPIGDDK